MTERTASSDPFAAIAAGPEGTRDIPLEEPRPYDGPWENLPVTEADKADAFQAPDPRDTPEAFAEDLAALRERHAPFLRRLAPDLPHERPRLALERFNWRVETEEDRHDPDRVFSGGGEWTPVAIPHYGEPLGRAVTHYRTTFTLEDDFFKPGAVFLHFGAVDYKAHVFLNGAYLGSHEGFFAAFEFDATAAARTGENTLLVRVENDAIFMGLNSWLDDPVQGDKIYAATGLGYDDPQRGWHHCPPGMGICRPVRLEARAPRHIHDLFIRPRREAGQLELTFEIWNTEIQDRPFALTFSIFGRNHEALVCEDRPLEDVNPAGPRLNSYTLTLDAPDLRDWDPDSPWLYELHAVLRDDDGAPVDAYRRHFGVRSFVLDESTTPRGRPVLNGREIRLRGANTMGHEQQCVFHRNFDPLIDDILIAKLAHLNFYRLTQRPVEPEVYEYCDMLGLMTQTDLPLFGVIRRPNVCEVIRQAEEMERHVRNSPANILVSYINEPFANARGKPERHLQREEMERLFEMLDRVVRLVNPDRAIKHVDGDYDPPTPTLPDYHCYNTWYNGHGIQLGKLHKGFWKPVLPGWLYGCGEYGAEGLEDVELMRERYPEEWLPHTPEEEREWSPQQIVKAQSGRFHFLWYETPHRLEDWVRASQEHQRWGVRLMTEAFRRDPRLISYALHLLIDAFPSGWMKTVVDCRRQPKAAFFAFRDASAPLLLSLRSDRGSFFSGEAFALELWLVNDTPDPHEGAEIAYQLRRADGRVTHTGRVPAQVPATDSRPQGRIAFPGIHTEARETVRVEAVLLDSDGRRLAFGEHAFEIFPAAPPTLEGAVRVFGAPDGPATTLALRLGLKPSADATDRLIVDGPAFEEHREPIEAAVREGARCLVLGLDPGEHRLGENRIGVRPTAMNPRHFASRDTGHPAVEGLRANDCKFWYNEDEGMVTPFLSSILEADAWTPILTAGSGDARLGQTTAAWKPYPAAAEKEEGDGRWILCQAELHNRVRTNPAAARLAAGLLGLGSLGK